LAVQSRGVKSIGTRGTCLAIAVITCLSALVMATPARADAIVSTISDFNNPRGVAVLPDSSAAYVVDKNSNAIKVIDTATDTVTSTINLAPAYSAPVGIVATPDGTKLYVDANNGSVDGLVEISVATNMVTQWHTPGLTGKESLSISPDGSTLYVAMGGNIAVIRVSDMTRTAFFNASPGGYSSATAVSPDGSKYFVTDLTGGGGRVRVYQTADNSLITTLDGFANPTGIAFSPDGAQLAVVNQATATSSVTYLDPDSYSTIATVTGFNRPAGIAFMPNGQKAYVTNSNNSGSGANSVSVTSRTYQISFNGNGFTSGTVPSSGAFTTGGSVFTVPGNTGSLEIAGYTFSGWNTLAGGTGTNYGPDSANTTYSTAASQTLFAKWTANQYAISFNTNGAPTGSTPSSGNYTTGGIAYTVPGNTGGLENPGFSFAGWNTRADGTGTTYGPGTANTSYSGLAALPLFAKWTAGTFPITFDANGALSGIVPIDGSYTTGDPAYPIPGNDGNLEREGFAFGGWNTRPDGTGTTYGPDSNYIDYEQGAPLELFAIWNSLDVPIDDTVWFQSYARAHETDTCMTGYSPSWAEWANDRRGGYVCNAAIYAYHPDDPVIHSFFGVWRER
jgi:uncharacterized repeat protein (TIGR02543 family)